MILTSDPGNLISPPLPSQMPQRQHACKRCKCFTKKGNKVSGAGDDMAILCNEIWSQMTSYGSDIHFQHQNIVTCLLKCE